LADPENGTWTPFHSASRLCPDHATRSRETANGLAEVLTADASPATAIFFVCGDADIVAAVIKALSPASNGPVSLQ
jgi:hypothetical protein